MKMLVLLMDHLRDLFCGLIVSTSEQDIKFFQKMIDDTLQAINEEIVRKRVESLELEGKQERKCHSKTK